MKAVIILLYYSRYGNTRRIAESLESSLRQAEGAQDVIVACQNVNDVSAADIDSLREYNVICIGAPTEGLTASRPMKEFLRKLRAIDLAGKYGFAFDTKLDSRLSGSAAKHIEKELVSRGLAILAPRESAIVFSTKEKGDPGGVRLREGEEERFAKIGAQLGRALAARAVAAPA